MSHAIAHGDPADDRAAPNRTLFILALGALAYTLAQTMIVPALPAIQRELHTSAADVTWLLTAFLISASIATPILGRFGDMYGKERMLLFALLLFGAGNLIGAFGHSLGVYILGRAVMGAGGAILPLAIGIIRDEFPRDKVATGIGTISAMFGIGGGAGLVISGVLVDSLGIDSIFWLGLGASVIAAIATWRYVPESPVRMQARIDYGGAVLLTATLLSLLLGVSEGQLVGLDEPADPRAVRACDRVRRDLGVVRAADRGPARRPAPDARARDVDGQPRRLRDRLRDVRLLHPDPAARPGGRSRPATGSARASSSAGSTCCPAPR